MSEQTDWQSEYRESAQYFADREKAMEMGHSSRAFQVSIAKSGSKEEWSEKLSRFQQPHPNN